MNRYALASILALAASAALPAEGRSKLEPPDLGRYLKWGPVRARPGIEVSNLGYDDNILSSGTNEVSDYTATTSPKIDGLILFGSRAFLEFSEKVEFTAYLDNRDQNYTNQRGSYRLTVPRRGIGFFLDGVLDRVNERPVELEDTRPERKRTGLGGGVLLEPGGRTEIELRYGTTGVAYTDPDNPGISNRLDRTEQLGSLNLSWSLFGRTRLTVDGSSRRTDFDELLGGVLDHDSSDWSLIPGLDFGRDGALSGSIRVGWSTIDADDPRIADFSDVVADASIAYRPNGRTTFRLEGRRRPGFSIYQDSIYYLDQRLELRGVYYFNRAIGVETGASAGRLTFPESVQNSTATSREDTFEAFDVGLRLRLAENSLGRRIEYRLRLGRSLRDSNLQNLDRSKTTVSFNATLGF